MLRELWDEEAEKVSSTKMNWLIEHLQEYLQRWLGFARRENIGVEPTLESDLFFMVLAATEVIFELQEAGGGQEFPNKEWSYFCNSLDWIQVRPDASELDMVVSAFDAFRRQVVGD